MAEEGDCFIVVSMSTISQEALNVGGAMDAQRMPAPIKVKLLSMTLATPIVLAAVVMLWAPILIVLSI